MQKKSVMQVPDGEISSSQLVQFSVAGSRHIYDLRLIDIQANGKFLNTLCDV
jgi:hypothetical protein